MGGTRLDLVELRDVTAGSPAEARVLVVDSCRSGALTRVKGGKPVANFDIVLDSPAAAQGFAILTSSAAGEDAQESDQLRASIFTHHLISGLLGAADRDHDGRVTIDEAFEYSSERTLAATAFTLPGPQHPTYRLEIGGRNDLILSEPGRAARDRGFLAFVTAGTYLVQRGGPEGAVAAEISSNRPGGRIALQPGTYFVSERHRDFLRQGTSVVSLGTATEVRSEELQRVDYARVVRKGAAERDVVYGAFASGGIRSQLSDLGTAWRSDIGARCDLRSVSFELRLGLGNSDHRNSRILIDSRELSATLAGLHMVDLRWISAGVGLEVGAAWLAQGFSDPRSKSRDLLAGIVAPIVEGEIPLGHRAYARVDAALTTYLLKTDAERGFASLLGYRVTAGAGMYFSP
jgi:hypothetical protein